MISETAISNITDLSFFWRSSYAQKVYIVYQLSGETEWKILSGTGSPDGNYTGSHGWDTRGYSTFNSGSWKEKELYGATAKIGIACTEAPSESGSLPISAVLVNVNKAAVKYLNLLTYNEHICSENGENKQFDLTKGQSDKVHNQDLFQLATEYAEGSFLGEYICTGTKTSEYYILGLYNHLVTSIPTLGSVKASSSRLIGGFINSVERNTYTVIAIIAVVSISSVILFAFIKKKKEINN